MRVTLSGTIVFFQKIIHYFKKDITFNIEIEKDIANEKKGLKKKEKKYMKIFYIPFKID